MKSKRLNIASLIKSNPSVDVKLIVQARAEIELLRKSGVVPNGYNLATQRAPKNISRRDVTNTVLVPKRKVN